MILAIAIRYIEELVIIIRIEQRRSKSKFRGRHGFTGLQLYPENRHAGAVTATTVTITAVTTAVVKAAPDAAAAAATAAAARGTAAAAAVAAAAAAAAATVTA